MSQATLPGLATAPMGDLLVSEQLAKDWRRLLPNSLRQRSLAKGLAIFLFVASVYITAFLGAFLLPNAALRLLSTIICTILMGGLMVIGHDAAHQSLTPIRWLNHLIARLCFLPLYHPYTSWVHSHNWLHHGYTNLKGKHPDFAPLSKAEFDRAPRWRQLLERIYRSPAGVGLSYLIEFWLKHMWFPTGVLRPRNTFAFTADRIMVVLFAIGQYTFAYYLALQSPNRFLPAGLLVIVSVFMPWLVWLCSMGMASFVQHTHPTIAWYDQEEDWRFFSAQLRSSTHMTMPIWMDAMLLFIMDHAAHHIDPSIPLYNLPASQQLLEKHAGDHAVIIPWSFAEYFRICRLCKLYDFDEHRWLDFEGHPTTPKLLGK